MRFTVFGKERIEKLLLINILGTLEALKNKKVTIDESEKVVFTPYINPNIIDSIPTI